MTSITQNKTDHIIAKINVKSNRGIIPLILLACLMTQTQFLKIWGVVIWILMGLISYSNINFTVFYLTLSQILPDIMGLPGNLAQWAVIIWLGYRLFSKHKINIKIIKPIASFLFPLLIWLLISSIVNGEVPTYFFDLLKGTIFSFIIYETASGGDIDFSDISAYVILACIFSSLPFWLGEKIALNEYIGFLGGNRGFIRIEGYRGNANFVMILLCFALVGIYHRYTQAKLLGIKSFLSSFTSFILVSLICIPPLIATQSRTPLLLIPSMFIIISIIETLIIKNVKKIFLIIFEITIILFILILTLNSFLPSWYQRIQATIAYQTQGGNLFSGRLYTWMPGIKIIINHPIFGTNFSEYTYITGGILTSHNTFIDSGIVGGIPALLFNMLYLLSPFFILSRNYNNRCFRLFLILYLTGLFISLSIALQGNKIMYILWSLLFTIDIQNQQQMDLLHGKKISSSPIRCKATISDSNSI